MLRLYRNSLWPLLPAGVNSIRLSKGKEGQPLSGYGNLRRLSLRVAVAEEKNDLSLRSGRHARRKGNSGLRAQRTAPLRFCEKLTMFARS